MRLSHRGLLIQPVDESQTGNRLEIDCIVCDKRHVVSQGSSSDQRIHVRHGCSAIQHLSPQFPKSQCDLKIDFDDIQQFDQFRDSISCLRTSLCPLGPCPEFADGDDFEGR